MRRCARNVTGFCSGWRISTASGRSSLLRSASSSWDELYWRHCLMMTIPRFPWLPLTCGFSLLYTASGSTIGCGRGAHTAETGAMTATRNPHPTRQRPEPGQRTDHTAAVSLSCTLRGRPPPAPRPGRWLNASVTSCRSKRGLLPTRSTGAGISPGRDRLARRRCAACPFMVRTVDSASPYSAAISAIDTKSRLPRCTVMCIPIVRVCCTIR
ncbi:Uncharacterised protein [Mycobacteroides abscessus subsp. bolletii]|nr:Uncharacterised protein [Mycobacteroides abscessus]SKF61950.1 Uncharacterised protein [Mycobacteroides abscessus subsp. bolletii]SKH89241.1 Uncharacterised protein [Mycobacteroides abscessus subsp. bolletii]